MFAVRIVVFGEGAELCQLRPDANLQLRGKAGNTTGAAAGAARAIERRLFPSRRHRVHRHPRAFAWHHPRPAFFRDRSCLRET